MKEYYIPLQRTQKHVAKQMHNVDFTSWSLKFSLKIWKASLLCSQLPFSYSHLTTKTIIFNYLWESIWFLHLCVLLHHLLGFQENSHWLENHCWLRGRFNWGCLLPRSGPLVNKPHVPNKEAKPTARLSISFPMCKSWRLTVKKNKKAHRKFINKG